MPQDKIDLSDFDELFYDGLEIIKTESGLPTKGVKRRIKENISLEDIKQYIKTKLSTEIKKAKRDVLEEVIKQFNYKTNIYKMLLKELKENVYKDEDYYNLGSHDEIIRLILLIQEEINKLK